MSGAIGWIVVMELPNIAGEIFQFITTFKIGLIHRGSNPTTEANFTGQEHDEENQFDFFQARYLSSAQQRFLSPDPANAGADPLNPQSWNGYAYVNNNPLNAIDPTGMFLSLLPTKDKGDGGDGSDDPGDLCFRVSIRALCA